MMTNSGHFMITLFSGGCVRLKILISFDIQSISKDFGLQLFYAEG